MIWWDKQKTRTKNSTERALPATEVALLALATAAAVADAFILYKHHTIIHYFVTFTFICVLYEIYVNTHTHTRLYVPECVCAMRIETSPYACKTGMKATRSWRSRWQTGAELTNEKSTGLCATSWGRDWKKRECTGTDGKKNDVGMSKAKVHHSEI